MSSSCRVGRREKFGGGGRDIKTWHVLELTAQNNILLRLSPDSPVPSCILSISSSPSLQIMLKAPCPSHHSLDVWSRGNNPPREQRDNGWPASTPVHSSSWPAATWECPSSALNALWSVTGCCGSHRYASKIRPFTTLEEDKWLMLELRIQSSTVVQWHILFLAILSHWS